MEANAFTLSYFAAGQRSVASGLPAKSWLNGAGRRSILVLGVARPSPMGPHPAPDLIRRDFTATRPDVRLVGDITQINTWGGPVFLATVIDLFSREVVGYAIDDHHGVELAYAALVMARRDRRVRRRAIC